MPQLCLHPCKTMHVLLVAAASILAIVTLAGCGGGGSGDAVANVWYPFAREFPDALAVDIDGDSAIDIAFIEKGRYSRVEIDDMGGADLDYATFFNLVVYLQDPLAAGSFSRKSSYRLKREALSLATGDLDRDGLVDIALTQTDINSVAVFPQNPGNPGAFLARSNFQAGSLPVGIAIGELNGDFINDIAVAGEQSALLTNNPASPGSRFTESGIALPAQHFIATADIDSDSRNDLAFTSGNMVTVLFQDPEPAAAGNYTRSDEYASGEGTSGMAIADLNGDSLADLAVASNENMNGRVSIFFNEPLAAGTFQTPVHYGTDTRAVAVAIGNLNGDALPDLAVASDHEDGGSVAVLLQEPTNPGTFNAAVLYPGNHGVDDVAIADLNQDGLPDLLIADRVVIIPADDPWRWPYIRYQDAGNPGTFLEPSFLTGAD